MCTAIISPWEGEMIALERFHLGRLLGKGRVKSCNLDDTVGFEDSRSALDVNWHSVLRNSGPPGFELRPGIRPFGFELEATGYQQTEE